MWYYDIYRRAIASLILTNKSKIAVLAWMEQNNRESWEFDFIAQSSSWWDLMGRTWLDPGRFSGCCSDPLHLAGPRRDWRTRMAGWSLLAAFRRCWVGATLAVDFLEEASPSVVHYWSRNMLADSNAGKMPETVHIFPKNVSFEILYMKKLSRDQNEI